MPSPAPCNVAWGPSSPCGVVVGFWGLGFSFKLVSLGFRIKRYKASSRQGLREGLGCRFARVDSLCPALGLEPAFRQGLGLGVRV